MAVIKTQKVMAYGFNVAMTLWAALILGLAQQASAQPRELAQQLMNELEVEKTALKAVENSIDLFKTVPKSNYPEVQKKIDAMYAQAQAEAALDKAQQQTKVANQIKDEFVKKFTEAELKYLVQLAKYPVYKKLKNFMDSEPYNRILADPFIAKRSTLNKLKAQSKELENKAGSVTDAKK